MRSRRRSKKTMNSMVEGENKRAWGGVRRRRRRSKRTRKMTRTSKKLSKSRKRARRGLKEGYREEEK